MFPWSHLSWLEAVVCFLTEKSCLKTGAKWSGRVNWLVENLHLKEKLLLAFLFFAHTFCFMIISLMSSRSPTITLCDFITRSSRDSQSVSSVQARLKSARAGTSNSKEDGISSLEIAVSLVTTGCVTRVTVWLGAKFFFSKRTKKKENEKLEKQAKKLISITIKQP